MIIIGKALRWLAQGCAFVAAAAVVLMMLQIAVDVTLKNLFNLHVPLTATLVTKWYMVAAAFLPLGLVEMLDRNISVEIVYQHFSRRWRRIVGGAVCLLAVATVCIMVVPLWDEAVERMEAGSFIVENGRHLSVWETYFFLPVGFAVFGAVLAYRVAVLWGGFASGMGETPIDADADQTVDPIEEGI
ncbi:TRAP transporter small permease [Amorphus sp. 3PC139-8]|uniref:TRAP transporter small permease n=1 Tax=Amorphus sp. 3PC139-8 TaxID=2735676 RepID=UPI00345CFEF7